MTSAIDPTLGGSLDEIGAAVSKPELKTALTAAQTEITALQAGGGGGTGAVFTAEANGLVPASGTATPFLFLAADGTWAPSPSLVVEDLREWGSGAAVTVSSAAGVIEPVWATHFDNSQTVHLVRGGGDVTAGPLLVRFPAFSGAGRAVRTVQYEETVATMATAVIAVAGCTIANADGVAVVTEPVGDPGVFARLNIEATDPLSAAGLAGASVVSIAAGVVVANVASTDEGTHTVSFTVPGSTIDGQRRIDLPERASGALFGMEAKTLPTATALGEMQTTAGLGGSGAWGGITGTLSAQTDLQSALDANAFTVFPDASDYSVTAFSIATPPGEEDPVNGELRMFSGAFANKINFPSGISANSYGWIENAREARAKGLLPMGVSEGCLLTRDVGRDEPVRYDDVQLPGGRLCDRLRAEQEIKFGADAR